MDSKQWIQHRSGVGKKYEAKLLCDKNDRAWLIEKGVYSFNLYLDYDEYVTCPAPEKWVDVTGECSLTGFNEIKHGNCWTTSHPYRRIMRQEPFPHIIIERLEKP